MGIGEQAANPFAKKGIGEQGAKPKGKPKPKAKPKPQAKKKTAIKTVAKKKKR